MPTHFNQILDPNQVPAPVPQAPGQVPGGVVEGPPVDQQDRAQRVSGWTKFLEQLKNDPSIQQMMIQAGTTLLQGQRPGENISGLLGRSLQGGNLAGQFIQQNQLRAGQEQQRINIEGERLGITGALAEDTIATGQESRLTSKQTREQGKEAFPSIQEKRTAETKASQAETIIKEIEAKSAERKTLAGIKLTEAQAEAEKQLGEFRKRSKPTESQTQTLYKIWADANPTLRLQEVADKFIAYLGIKERAAMVTAATTIAADPTVPRAVRDGFIDFLVRERERSDAQRTRVPEPKRKLKPNEAEGQIRGAPANQGAGSIATPKTLDAYNALPSGTRYLNPDGTEKIKP